MVMTLAQNRDPSFLSLPAFRADVAFGRGPLELPKQLELDGIFAGREPR